MQQPLAHLYFLTLLEHLQAQKRNLPDLIRLAIYITQQCTSPDTRKEKNDEEEEGDGGRGERRRRRRRRREGGEEEEEEGEEGEEEEEEVEAILLWLEHQAVVQVIIQKLAFHLDPSECHMGEIQSLTKEINR